MSFLRDLLKQTKVLKAEKKLSGFEETARTWGQPEKRRRGPNSFTGGPQAHEAVRPEPADPDEVYWDAYRKRMAACKEVRPQDDARPRR
jgi:hypothetical protein